MNQHLDSVLQRQMTRKEFLATLGFGLASVMGFSHVIQLLTGKSVSHQLRRQTGLAASYGGSPYGGGRDG